MANQIISTNSDTSDQLSNNTIGIIIGCVIGGVVLILILSISVLIYRKKQRDRRNRNQNQDQDLYPPINNNMQTDEDLYPSINNFMQTNHIPCNGYNCCCHRRGNHSHVQHVVVITTPCCCNSRNIAPQVHYNNRPRNAIERQVPTAPEMRLSVIETLSP